VAWVIGALIALAVVVAVLAATTTGASRPPGAAGASASSPSYPAVAGRLGADLAALQQLVPALLRPDVLAVTEAAAAGNRDAAGSTLDTLTADLAAAQSAGQVDATRADSIRAAVTRIRADLAPAATPTPTASPTPTPSPPGGDGKAPGKDDKSPGKPGKK
jgi:hypothetical protein